jgi:hypothetical protein
MIALTPDRLLTVWERGARCHPIDRALLLFALAEPETPPERLADAPLGRRNAALLALYRAGFSDRVSAWVDCAACGSRMELELAAQLFPPVPEDFQLSLEVAGHRFHCPTSRHLARINGVSDPETAARRLFFACAESPDTLPEDEPALTELLDAIDAAMDDADPWADMSLAIRCPACGHEDTAALDLADLLWEEIESRVGHLIDDVHSLALAYGWSERDILSISETRRAAYLTRVQG